MKELPPSEVRCPTKKRPVLRPPITIEEQEEQDLTTLYKQARQHTHFQISTRKLFDGNFARLAKHAPCHNLPEGLSLVGTGTRPGQDDLRPTLQQCHAR